MLGETLGNYKIDSQIGSGGMGIVYSAEHVLLGKRAAIKVLKPERCESQEIVNRFFNEARAASIIKHPGIPEIFDYGHLPDGNAYIVMEMLEGVTLGLILEGNTRLSAGRALALTRLMAGTLMATHNAGIIHRDLKPDNVFVVPDPAMPRGERIQILDFGIAKLQNNSAESSVQTETGRLMGTPYYMSPEQCRGAGNIDHRTDIYSLGCVLYQMLCGRPPFAMRGSGEILAAHIHLVPQTPREIDPSIPVDLERLILKLLAKDPADRMQSMEEVIAEINIIAANSKGHAHEPSLEASMEMPVHLIQGLDNASLDTLDEAVESYFHGKKESGGDITTLGVSLRPQDTMTEAVRTSPKNFKRVVLPVAIVAGFALGAWGAWTFLRPASDSGEQSKPKVATAVPAPAAVPQIVVQGLVEVPKELEYVSLQVNSDPSGARVFRIADGVELGITPITVKVRAGQGKMGFMLRKRGFRNEEIEMLVSTDSQTMVVLAKKGSKRAGSSKAKSASSGPESAASAPSDLDVKEPPARGERGQIKRAGGASRLGTWTE